MNNKKKAMSNEKCIVNGNCHHFEPRYSTTEEIPPNVESMFKEYISQADVFTKLDINAFRRKTQTYICDICKYCGMRIDR